MYGSDLDLMRCDIDHHRQVVTSDLKLSRAIQKAIRQWSSRFCIYVGSKLIALGQAFEQPLTKPNESTT